MKVRASLLVLSLAVLQLLSSHATARPRRANTPIERTTPATLPASATSADVTKALTESRWMFLHPDKKTSLWESMTYVFLVDGKVEITTGYVDAPRTVVATWKVVRAGAAPLITIERARYRVVNCPRGDQKSLCLTP